VSYPPPLMPIPPPSVPTADRFAPRAMRWDIIAQLVREHGWTHGVEIGVADGRCADSVLNACPELELAVVDPWAPQHGHHGPENWADWPHAQFEAMTRNRLARYGARARVIRAYSEDAADMFAPESLDFVFLDGDHSEEGVRLDIACWRPKIRPGGALLGHDIAWPGVRRAVEDLCPGYWIGPNDVWGVAVPSGN
jgi:hypothetical protein